MKKGIVVVALLLMCSPGLANDNTVRVGELTKEANVLVEQLQQIGDAQRKVNIRLIQIDAIINELQREVEEDEICEIPPKTE